MSGAFSLNLRSHEAATPRQVVDDVHTRYFGVQLNDSSLTPSDKTLVGQTRFDEWLSRIAPEQSRAPAAR